MREYFYEVNAQVFINTAWRDSSFNHSLNGPTIKLWKENKKPDTFLLNWAKILSLMVLKGPGTLWNLLPSLFQRKQMERATKQAAWHVWRNPVAWPRNRIGERWCTTTKKDFIFPASTRSLLPSVAVWLWCDHLLGSREYFFFQPWKSTPVAFPIATTNSSPGWHWLSINKLTRYKIAYPAHGNVKIE